MVPGPPAMHRMERSRCSANPYRDPNWPTVSRRCWGRGNGTTPWLRRPSPSDPGHRPAATATNVRGAHRPGHRDRLDPWVPPRPPAPSVAPPFSFCTADMPKPADAMRDRLQSLVRVGCLAVADVLPDRLPARRRAAGSPLLPGMPHDRGRLRVRVAQAVCSAPPHFTPSLPGVHPDESGRTHAVQFPC